MLARMLMNDSPLAQMSREMDRVFGREFARPLGRLNAPVALPALNAWHDDAALHVEAELPGFRLEDIEILASDESLTIRGTREITTPEGATALRTERVTGSFERAITLPVPIDVDHVGATLRDGVLHITLPLTPEVKPRRIAVTA